MNNTSYWICKSKNYDKNDFSTILKDGTIMFMEFCVAEDYILIYDE